ncbi:MAG: hypothetical protein QG653_566 [Patescibacteria group bacterium]|nr:hypothetical protein [Patescibacteria group bacterium]
MKMIKPVTGTGFTLSLSDLKNDRDRENDENADDGTDILDRQPP